MKHFLHVGYPKSASTWLQRHVFPTLAGFHDTRPDPLFRQLIQHVRFAPDERYLADSMKCLVEEAAHRANAPIILTEEGLVGEILYHVKGPATDPERTARRLRAALGDAVVLIVVRRQQDLLRSLHSHHVRVGGASSLEQFVRGELPSGQHLELADLEYDRVVTRYRAQFGDDRVLVLPFELLREQADRFREQLSAALGASIDPSVVTKKPSNVSLGKAGTWLMRHWNRAFRTSIWNPTPLVAMRGIGELGGQLIRNNVDPLLPRGEVERDLLDGFAQRFAASNARLQALCAEPLGPLGYVGA